MISNRGATIPGTGGGGGGGGGRGVRMHREIVGLPIIVVTCILLLRGANYTVEKQCTCSLRVLQHPFPTSLT